MKSIARMVYELPNGDALIGDVLPKAYLDEVRRRLKERGFTEEIITAELAEEMLPRAEWETHNKTN